MFYSATLLHSTFIVNSVAGIVVTRKCTWCNTKCRCSIQRLFIHRSQTSDFFYSIQKFLSSKPHGFSKSCFSFLELFYSWFRFWLTCVLASKAAVYLLCSCSTQNGRQREDTAVTSLVILQLFVALWVAAILFELLLLQICSDVDEVFTWIFRLRQL